MPSFNWSTILNSFNLTQGAAGFSLRELAPRHSATESSSFRRGEFGPIVRRTANDSALIPRGPRCAGIRATCSIRVRSLPTRMGGGVSRSLPLLPEAFLQASFLSHPGELQRVTGQRTASIVTVSEDVAAGAPAGRQVSPPFVPGRHGGRPLREHATP